MYIKLFLYEYNNMKSKIIRYLLSSLIFLQSITGFVKSGSPMIKLRHDTTYCPIRIQLSLKNNTIIPKMNTSKVFKMDYSEDDEYENLFKPRYMFGLSEYNMILIRLYVYMVIILHILTVYADKIKK